jgi:hypothetical protein
MAIEAPIDHIRPIIPDTNAIGKIAITVNVANIVGFPTSFIAYIAA